MILYTLKQYALGTGVFINRNEFMNNETYIVAQIISKKSIGSHSIIGFNDDVVI